MSENVVSGQPSGSEVCRGAVEVYKNLGKTIQAPAIRKVFEAIIRQKQDQAAALAALEAADPAARAFQAQAPMADVTADPETMLTAVVNHETAFASALDSLAGQEPGEDARHQIKGLADMSRKFAQWAKDHIELLALF